MKKMMLMLLLLLTIPMVAAPPPSPADFPLTLHVVYSSQSGSGVVQRIDLVIDGQPTELSCGASGVLTLGDYPARVSPKVSAPKSWSAYDNMKGYDLLMPDAKVRTCIVTAVGTALLPTSSNP
jgi:hypothetical protein